MIDAKHLDPIGRLLTAALDDIKATFERDGPRPVGDNPGRLCATLVLRIENLDGTTIVFGDDDEAALIVALTELGTSRDRRRFCATHDGVREGDA